MKRTIRMLAAALAVCSVLTFSACNGKDNENVVGQKVESLMIVPMSNQYNGEVIPQETLSVKKKEDSHVKEVLVKVGDTVKAGDVLFRYDVEQIQFEVLKAQLEIDKLQNQIASGTAQIEQLETEKEKANDDQQLRYSVEISTLQTEIKEAQYNAETKKAEMVLLQKQAQNADVTTTIDGVVQEVNTTPAANQGWGNPGSSEEQAFIKIMQTGSFRVKGRVNELNAYEIVPGSPVILTSRMDGKEFKGTIASIETQSPEKNNTGMEGPGMQNGDTSTQSVNYPFFVDLESSEGLMLGQHVIIKLATGMEETPADPNQVRIPITFVEMAEDGFYVYMTKKSGKPEKTKIEGQMDNMGMFFVVTSGLTKEDYIVSPYDIMTENPEEQNNQNGGMEESMPQNPSEPGENGDMGSVPEENIPPAGEETMPMAEESQVETAANPEVQADASQASGN